ncbi:MAG: hypothetical protein HYV60_00935 [Planctomycetia bacterium]|nr:hypothetical protein [Planctomycetia bacterium]
MPLRFRKNWSHDVDEVIRSRHYNWLGYGLGGDPVEQAMATLTADIMHICKRRGIPWRTVLERGREQFEQEEAAVSGSKNQHPVSLRSRDVAKPHSNQVSTHTV